MISFSNPAWLWGLLGLLVPIAIHLLSRKEGKTIYIGSIRHLADSDTAQFSSIRLNELLLLILRSLLITLLVFILAGFSISTSTTENQKWVVVEKGVEKDLKYKNVLDTLTLNGFEFHWLAEEFPLQDDSASTGLSNYYRLIEQLSSRKLDSAVILSHDFAKYFKGSSASLPKNIQWLNVEPQENISVVKTVKLSGDSVIARIIKSTSNGTQLHYSRTTSQQLTTLTNSDSANSQTADTIKISIVTNKEFDYDRKIIHATLHAIENTIPVKIDINSNNDINAVRSDDDFVFWLSNLPCTINKKKTIGFAKCANTNLSLLITKDKALSYCSETSNLDWIITQRLTEENILAENFSFKIAQLLTSDFGTREIAERFDRRSFLHEALFTSKESDQIPLIDEDDKAKADVSPILFILLLLTLVIERFIALKRNQ